MKALYDCSSRNYLYACPSKDVQESVKELVEKLISQEVEKKTMARGPQYCEPTVRELMWRRPFSVKNAMEAHYEYRHDVDYPKGSDVSWFEKRWAELQAAETVVVGLSWQHGCLNIECRLDQIKFLDCSYLVLHDSEKDWWMVWSNSSAHVGGGWNIGPADKPFSPYAEVQQAFPSSFQTMIDFEKAAGLLQLIKKANAKEFSFHGINFFLEGEDIRFHSAKWHPDSPEEMEWEKKFPGTLTKRPNERGGIVAWPQYNIQEVKAIPGKHEIYLLPAFRTGLLQTWIDSL